MVTNEEPVAMATVEIEGQQAQSNENGMVTLSLPLEMQRKAYKIKTDFTLVNDSIFMPCGEDDVILVERDPMPTSLP